MTNRSGSGFLDDFVSAIESNDLNLIESLLSHGKVDASAAGNNSSPVLVHAATDVLRPCRRQPDLPPARPGRPDPADHPGRHLRGLALPEREDQRARGPDAPAPQRPAEGAGRGEPVRESTGRRGDP